MNRRIIGVSAAFAAVIVACVVSPMAGAAQPADPVPPVPFAIERAGALAAEAARLPEEVAAASTAESAPEATPAAAPSAVPDTVLGLPVEGLALGGFAVLAGGLAVATVLVARRQKA
ncbi:hypothetical protein [Agromyces sp. LHK192]|uniref:hypothetical protein n=1 Tax=Agromyces sp. LHK192 TaxID=2498704 RepID=UPI000FD76810|nr:hypothetical protein [Agromyces sp. LHK192]